VVLLPVVQLLLDDRPSFAVLLQAVGPLVEALLVVVGYRVAGGACSHHALVLTA
jgi:hypothetical protein